MGDEETAPDRAIQQRHLLPRWPSDGVVAALLVAGLVGMFLIVGGDRRWSVWLLVPGALASVVQKVGGHVAAWRSEAVERAFVTESGAIAFYVGVAGLVVIALLQSIGVVGSLDATWLVLGALFVDTTVRKLRERRFA